MKSKKINFRVALEYALYTKASIDEFSIYLNMSDSTTDTSIGLKKVIIRAQEQEN